MQHKTGLVHLGYIVWDYFYSNIVTLVKVAWLLYRADAADDLLRVDLGGRRISNKTLVQ